MKYFSASSVMGHLLVRKQLSYNSYFLTTSRLHLVLHSINYHPIAPLNMQTDQSPMQMCKQSQVSLLILN